jgi:NAD(P)H-nitrite reductase large subunit
LKEETIICRCEDVTYGQILKAIDEGFTTLEEIKRMLRCGMGACQGRTCVRLISRIIAERTGRPMHEIMPPTARPPSMPVELAVLAGEAQEAADEHDSTGGA